MWRQPITSIFKIKFFLISQIYFSLYNMQQRRDFIAYSVGTFTQIKTDSDERMKLITKFKKLVDKKMQIDKDYAHKIKSLQAETKPINAPNKCLEHLYNDLVMAIKVQTDDINDYLMRMKFFIVQDLQKKLNDIVKEQKKIFSDANLQHKQIQMIKEQYKKIDKKYLDKSYDLKEKIQNYMVGILGGISLDQSHQKYAQLNKTNQKEYHQLYTQHHMKNQEYNSIIKAMTDKFQQTIKIISGVENTKVSIVKETLTNMRRERNKLNSKQARYHSEKIQEIQKNINPDLRFYGNQANTFCQPFLDPSGYIVKLYNILKEVRMLSQYGQSQDYRESLRERISGIGEQIENPTNPKITQITNLFKMAFDPTKELTSQIIQTLKQLMSQDAQSRKDFIICLQIPRRDHDLFQLTKNSYPKIVSILNTFLDLCFNERDTYNPKQLILLTNSYYCVDGNDYLYLSEEIRKHKIWQDQQWWECSILQKIYFHYRQDRNRFKKAKLTPWDVKGTGSKRSRVELDPLFQQIIENLLRQYLNQMKQFSIAFEIMSSITKKFIYMFSLNEKLNLQLEKIVRNSSMSFISDTRSSMISQK